MSTPVSPRPTAASSTGSGTLTKAAPARSCCRASTSIPARRRSPPATLSVAADSAFGAVPGSPTPGQLTFNGGTLLVTDGLHHQRQPWHRADRRRHHQRRPGRDAHLRRHHRRREHADQVDRHRHARAVGRQHLYRRDDASPPACCAAEQFRPGHDRGRHDASPSGAAIEIDGSGLNIAENITSLIGTGVSTTGACATWPTTTPGRAPSRWSTRRASTPTRAR